MRSLLSLAALLFVVTSGEDVTPAIHEEQPHQRQTFFNWDYKDLGTSAFETLLPFVPPPAEVVPFDQREQCPDGWLRFSDSCYWVETDAFGFAKAERKCAEKHATLFVANSPEEWETVMARAKDASFSWIGLVRFTHFEKMEQLPRWQTTGSINPSKINWLIRPFSPLANGWSSFANCAASYNSPSQLESASYTFFYPCTLQFNSICERNSTIIHAPL